MTQGDNSPTSATASMDPPKSALQDNIERMGKNAYYFAHAHKATGPKWDGKIEPRLLSSSSNLSASDGGGESVDVGVASVSVTNSAAAAAVALRSISLSKSNITNYAFMDEGEKVKIYVNLPSVGSTPSENIALESTERSLCLTIKGYIAVPNPAADKDLDDLICDTSKSSGDTEENCDEMAVEGKEPQPRGEDRCLSFARLYGEIESATLKKRPDKIIITLKKKEGNKPWTSVIA
ncbi:hypothetical protein HJC23_010296 [Cyclotella cryptica]|uniref:CS domain-containing protein n=1 Tax=Cyclotella cryptica TaxID=29204 RepID=A0ABD3QPA9_9STRA|eukprot:CCRYP_003700-RA/>CCRYP_003700-RA protein AED:0.23 eAED:0.23 QI:0/-1/0/1/-1/1/1/0/235